MVKATPVLIVGAGPSGLTLALALARRGIKPRIIDKARAPSATSKALGIHARTLEIFEDMGLTGDVLGQGLQIHGANIFAEGRRIAHMDFGEIKSPFSFVISLPQSNTEVILIEALRRYGVEVERGVTLKKLEVVQRDLAHVTLEHPGGQTEQHEVTWLIGCDGAHSTVRHELGFPFTGETYSESFALADVQLDWSLPQDEMVTFMASKGVLAMIPMPGEGRYRVVADLGLETEEAGDARPELTLEDFQQLVDTRSHMRVKLSNPTWLAGFHIHRRMVNRYRRGPVFLVGDAAHIHSPVGGQGMNTGIQDAYNLGWKLALVLQKRAYLSLLGSYASERLPIAASTLEATDRATRVVSLRGTISQQLRNSLASVLSNFEVVQEKIAQNLGMLTLNYRQSPVVDQHRDSIAAPALIARRSSQESPSWRDWLDFGAAPTPGDRAPDVVYDGFSGDKPRRLFDLMRGIHHTLLLFDGQASTDAGYRNMERIGRLVNGRFGAHFEVHMVVPGAVCPPGLKWNGSVILDRENALHRRFGAGSDCLYLIRPDGYIGYRSQPSDMKKLFRYLDRIFI